MDLLLLSRLQFGATTIYHFFFVPLTLGLSVIVAVMETLYVVKKDETYKQMAKFWGKLFLVNFAMGVVTGIVLEFQFGMNWSEYSRYVGDVFGAPLAIEALLAFFLESTFLGIWIFGWEKLSKKAHLVTIWLAALGANISGFWILVANSFMQEPVGFIINPETGRAQMVDFFALLTNPNLKVMFPHTIFAGLSTGAFFVLGITAYHFIKKTDRVEFFKKSFLIGTVAAFISVLGVVGFGHQQAQHMVRTQPMKMAAAEALYNSEDPASLSLFTMMDLQGNESFSIRIPGALSFLAYNRFTGEVQGINQLQAQFEEEYGEGNYTPPVFISYWSFRIMVGLGFAMLGLAFVSILLIWKKAHFTWPTWIMWVFVGAISFPYLANTTGWILTEVGRYPWVVYGFLKMEDAISPNITPAMVLTTLIGFILLYALLMVADLYLLVRFAKAGPDNEQPPQEPELDTTLVLE